MTVEDRAQPPRVTRPAANPAAREPAAGYTGPVPVSRIMNVRQYLAAGLAGAAAAVVVTAVWVGLLAPPPDSPLRPFLDVLVAAPTVVVVAIGTTALALARVARGDTGDGSEAAASRRRAGGASLVASALGFCAVATATSLALADFAVLGPVAGFGVGAVVALAVALGAYDRLSPAGGSVFAAGRFGLVATVLTAGAAGVMATLVAVVAATFLLVREAGPAPGIPLISIPVGVASGVVVAAAAVAVLRWHVRGPAPGESRPPPGSGRT